MSTETMEIADNDGRSLEVEYEVVEEVGDGWRYWYANVLSALPDGLNRDHVAEDIEERLAWEMKERAR